MDLAQATSAPEELTLGGQTFHVRLLTMKDWGHVQVFIKKELPSPVTRAYIAIQQAKDQGSPLDPAVEDRMLDRAEQKALAWPPRLGSEAWFDALGAIAGGDAKLLHEVLSKCNPDFTPERAEVLAPTLTTGEWGDLIRVALWGTHPRKKDDPAEQPAPEA